MLVAFQDHLRKSKVKLVFTFRQFVNFLEDQQNFFVVVWSPRVVLLTLLDLERDQVVLRLSFDLDGLRVVW